jgi:hypothetical protein
MKSPAFKHSSFGAGARLDSLTQRSRTEWFCTRIQTPGTTTLFAALEVATGPVHSGHYRRPARTSRSPRARHFPAIDQLMPPAGVADECFHSALDGAYACYPMTWGKISGVNSYFTTNVKFPVGKLRCHGLTPPVCSCLCDCCGIRGLRDCHGRIRDGG